MFQQLLLPFPKAVKLSVAMLKFSQAKGQAHKRCLDPHASSAAKAVYRRQDLASPGSVAADWGCYWDQSETVLTSGAEEMTEAR